LIGFAKVGPAAVVAGVTPTRQPPANTPVPTREPPPPPTVPPVYPTATYVPITEVFRPAPSAGGSHILGVPAILWAAGLGLVLIGVGLAARRTR
jgi:hypothetical protein